jgi:hypothetical protein
MRALLPALLLSCFQLFPSSGNAGDTLPQITVSENEKVKATNPSEEAYRGYVLHLSQIAGRKDFAEIANTLRHQVDIVESVGLSPRVIDFVHTVPIVADELACLEKELSAAGCYDLTIRKPLERTKLSVWDSEKSQWTNSDPVYPLASNTRDRVVYVRPSIKFGPQNPILLHEMLHAFHDQIMPQGFANQGVLFHYNLVKSKQLYPAEAYLLTNHMEFFAVTAAVFLYGKDAKEPFTRANLKEKQPDYFKYLVGLFGFDPDRAPSATPVASAY